nr:hypothetical protein [Burkholderia ubonensis]
MPAPNAFLKRSRVSRATHFVAVTFDLDTAAVSIRPFVRDWATIEADGLDERAAIGAFKSWLLAWFDADDENAPAEDGLHGIVHDLSEPVRTEPGWPSRICCSGSSMRARRGSPSGESSFTRHHACRSRR